MTRCLLRLHLPVVVAVELEQVVMDLTVEMVDPVVVAEEQAELPVAVTAPVSPLKETLLALHVTLTHLLVVVVLAEQDKHLRLVMLELVVLESQIIY